MSPWQGQVPALQSEGLQTGAAPWAVENSLGKLQLRGERVRNV